MHELLFIGLAGFLLGLLILKGAGPQSNRTVKAKTIIGGVNQGDVTINNGVINHHAAPEPKPPARGWVEWLGFWLTGGGFVTGAIGLYLTLYPSGA